MSFAGRVGIAALAPEEVGCRGINGLSCCPLLPILKFEPLTASHTADTFRLWSDFEAVKYTNWSYTPTIDACSERIAKVIAYYGKEPLHFGPYAICHAENRFVGIIGADLAATSAGDYDVWYFILREEWGKGIGSQALGDLIECMRVSGRVKKATASVVVVNTASWRLLERFGFVRDRVVPGGFQKHGLTLDICSYEREFEGGN
jgi:RimJ/RimL family protein N-acetyltransferase